jgi:hypothetical protein
MIQPLTKDERDELRASNNRRSVRSDGPGAGAGRDRNHSRGTDALKVAAGAFKKQQLQPKQGLPPTVVVRTVLPADGPSPDEMLQKLLNALAAKK